MELFVNGDPRFLSGGKRRAAVSYDASPATVEQTDGSAFDTAAAAALSDTEAAAVRCGQAVHRGKAGYHDTPLYNVFLRDGEWPSAGIELETHLRRFDDMFAKQAMDDLHSNWFHFERDGSLDREHGGRYGFELITEPLPPRAYRDQRLWTGLQNLCTPWLQSFQCQETGLHVHVGLNQFEGFDTIPFGSRADRRAIGKLLSAVVYYCVADQAFVDRVALRKPTSYCAMPGTAAFTDAAARIASGTTTGAALVDYCAAALMRPNETRWESGVAAASAALRPGAPREHRTQSMYFPDAFLASGHSTEINQAHPYTVEFRRAKGTMHALSIHRIVELMTSIVRFAGKCCREPDFRVTRESFMDWLISTTTSEALRNLAKQTKGD